MKSIVRLVFLFFLLSGLGVCFNPSFADDSVGLSTANVKSLKLETFQAIWNESMRKQPGLQLKGPGQPTNDDADYRGYPFTKDTVLYLITSDDNVVEAQLYGTKDEVRNLWLCASALINSMEPTTKLPERSSVLKKIGFVVDNKMPDSNSELTVGTLRYNTLADDTACELDVQRTDALEAVAAAETPARSQTPEGSSAYNTGVIIGQIAAYLVLAGIAIFFVQMIARIFSKKNNNASDITIASIRRARGGAVDDADDPK